MTIIYDKYLHILFINNIMESYIENNIIKRKIVDVMNVTIDDFIKLSYYYKNPNYTQEEEEFKLNNKDIDFIIKLTEESNNERNKKLLQRMIKEFKKNPKIFNIYNKCDAFISNLFFWVLKIKTEKIRGLSTEIFNINKLLKANNILSKNKFDDNKINHFKRDPEFFYCMKFNNDYLQILALPIIVTPIF